ncbi:MAG: helix-turn-helix domain-containing protein [Pseudomonadota bacterium]
MTDTTVPADWYHDDKATLGDRITYGREVAGLSQDALAKRLGIKLRTLKEWEDDLSEPRANKLQMLAGVLNVSLRWLMTGHGDDLSHADYAVSPEELAALRARLQDALDLLARIEERLGDGH